jgi:hypothetical protein
MEHALRGKAVRAELVPSSNQQFEDILKAGVMASLQAGRYFPWFTSAFPQDAQCITGLDRIESYQRSKEILITGSPAILIDDFMTKKIFPVDFYLEEKAGAQFPDRRRIELLINSYLLEKAGYGKAEVAVVFKLRPQPTPPGTDLGFSLRGQGLPIYLTAEPLQIDVRDTSLVHDLIEDANTHWVNCDGEPCATLPPDCCDRCRE